MEPFMHLDQERYSRQTLVPQVGIAGQPKLAAGRIAVAGCGALGSATASLLARAGVGYIRLIDRDFVEISNLQRQRLYTEADVASGIPKAAIAAQRLAEANSEIILEAEVTDLSSANAEALLSDVDVIVDAIDNLEGRFLINDVALKHSIPWIYGAVISTYGLSMTILAGEGPCIRCLLPETPAPGTVDTCATAGIFGPIVDWISGLQASEAMKLLLGQRDQVSRGLCQVDVWDRELEVSGVPVRPDCPACAMGRYEFLEADATSETVSLCGQDALQISMPSGSTLDLEDLGARLVSGREVLLTPFMVRFEAEGHEINVFADGRAIIKGTTDPALGRMLYAKYVGT